MSTVGVIGKDGRTSAICRHLQQSDATVVRLPWTSGAPDAAIAAVLEQIDAHRIDLVVVGPEDPLAAGVADALHRRGIPCVGPRQAAARLETSKAFTRELLRKFEIPGNPRYRVFRTLDGTGEFLRELGEYVIKPDGLTGGKGVKVSGDHLSSLADGQAYCEELLQHGSDAVVIEERLDGEEFSLMSFCDGTSLVDMPVVQDHKRAFDGDRGPNTGGMGSYSCSDHSLPFLSADDVRQASEINRAVARAVREETGVEYKGVLYGGFMRTANGIRLIEYNARFGDPEALNIFSVLRTPFGRICRAIVEGTLGSLSVEFAPLATVCKYIVPQGYPADPVRNASVDPRELGPESDDLKIYPAAIEERDGRWMLTGSRAIGFVGIHHDIAEAARIAEEAAAAVKGPVYHRTDIGSEPLIAQRIRHIETLTKHAVRSHVPV
jgi:phosphoribosylamine---glycine ligase